MQQQMKPKVNGLLSCQQCIPIYAHDCLCCGQVKIMYSFIMTIYPKTRMSINIVLVLSM